MKYDDEVADELISIVTAKAKVYWDIAKEIEDAKPINIFLRSQEDFRSWSYNKAVSNLLYELVSDMEQTRIRHILDDEERGRERDMDMMVRMGR